MQVKDKNYSNLETFNNGNEVTFVTATKSPSSSSSDMWKPTLLFFTRH